MNESREETQLWQDPIVEEVRSVRQALLAACDNDLEELTRWLRQRQQDEGRTVVTLPPRQPEEPQEVGP